MPYKKIKPEEEVRGGVFEKIENELERIVAEKEVDIAKNVADIGASATAIIALQSAVGANTSEIGVNASAIIANAAATIVNSNAITTLQTNVAKKVIQQVVAGVGAGLTITLANAPSSIISVLAVVSATGAPATKALLDLTTDYTVSGTTLTCVTDQSLNKLIVTYLV